MAERLEREQRASTSPLSARASHSASLAPLSGAASPEAPPWRPPGVHGCCCAPAPTDDGARPKGSRAPLPGPPGLAPPPRFCGVSADQGEHSALLRRLVASPRARFLALRGGISCCCCCVCCGPTPKEAEPSFSDGCRSTKAASLFSSAEAERWWWSGKRDCIFYFILENQARMLLERRASDVAERVLVCDARCAASGQPASCAFNWSLRAPCPRLQAGRPFGTGQNGSGPPSAQRQTTRRDKSSSETHKSELVLRARRRG